MELAPDAPNEIIGPARTTQNPFASYAGASGGFADLQEINTWISELRDDSE